MEKRLSYEEFIEYCSKNIRKVMGEKNYKTSINSISHTDNYVTEGIMLEPNNNSPEKIMTSIRTKKFYEEYLDGKALGTIIYEMISVLESREGFKMPFNLDEALKNYELLKPHLIIRAINYPNSKKLLEQNIFSLIGDIAIVIYSIIDSNKEGLMSVKIPKTFFPKWNITEKQLFDDAIRNTAQRFKPVLLDMDIMNILSQMVNDDKKIKGKSFMNPLTPINIEKTIFGTCLTTEKKLNGATAVFYPGVLERLGNILNEDFYIVFMSIHEAIIHPISITQLDKIRGLGGSIEKNGLLLNQTEFLSNNIYLYSRKDKQMKLV